MKKFFLWGNAILCVVGIILLILSFWIEGLTNLERLLLIPPILMQALFFAFLYIDNKLGGGGGNA